MDSLARIALTGLVVLASGCKSGTRGVESSGKVQEPLPATRQPNAGPMDTVPPNLGYDDPSTAPIADLDPAFRASRQFQVPTRLTVRERAFDSTVVPDGHELLEVDIACRAATGFRSSLFRWRAGELQDRSREPDVVSISGMARTSFGSPRSQEQAAIDLHLELFETDVPDQHMWSPQGGTYFRVVWDRWIHVDL